ncbi:MAG: hypothetical protein R3C68_16120 [Myxococcota bacterium]
MPEIRHYSKRFLQHPNPECHDAQRLQALRVVMRKSAGDISYVPLATQLQRSSMPASLTQVLDVITRNDSRSNFIRECTLIGLAFDITDKTSGEPFSLQQVYGSPHEC